MPPSSSSRASWVHLSATWPTKCGRLSTTSPWFDISTLLWFCRWCS
jgi:hypothetical protein